MVEYKKYARKRFDKDFDAGKFGGDNNSFNFPNEWENMGGFFTKKSAINQMKNYKPAKTWDKLQWFLVPPAKRTKNSGGYYNVLIRRKRR
jgi:hypothetical protein